MALTTDRVTSAHLARRWGSDALRDWPLGRLLAVGGRMFSQRFGETLAGYGMTPAGYAVLSRLSTAGRMAARDVASACYVRPATVTGVVDTLEREGLVCRVRDQADRRMVAIELTSAGRERLRSSEQGVRRLLDPLFAGLSKKDEYVVREFLVTVIDQLQQETA